MLTRRSRPHRVPRLTLLAAAMLLTGSLAGCGFDYRTDQVNIVSAGINDREGPLDVLGAVVIAGEDDRGLFVATLVNNDLESQNALNTLDQSDQLDFVELDEPFVVPAGGRFNMFDDGGIPVSGTFSAGQFVDVTLAFASGQVSSLEVPVVTPCHQYSLDLFPELTLPTGTPGTTGTESEAATTEAEPTESEAAETDNEAIEADPYSCEPLAPVDPHGGEE